MMVSLPCFRVTPLQLFKCVYDDTRNKNQPTEIRTAVNCVRPKNGHTLEISFRELFVFVGAARCQSNSYFSLTRYRGDIIPQHSRKCPTSVFYTKSIKLHLKKYAADTVNITLTREKTNRFDSNAIAVYVSVKGSKACRIGYIQAHIAKLLSGVIDNITEIKASLKYITGGFYDGMLYGLLLNLSI